MQRPYKTICCFNPTCEELNAQSAQRPTAVLDSGGNRCCDLQTLPFDDSQSKLPDYYGTHGLPHGLSHSASYNVCPSSQHKNIPADTDQSCRYDDSLSHFPLQTAPSTAACNSSLAYAPFQQALPKQCLIDKTLDWTNNHAFGSQRPSHHALLSIPSAFFSPTPASNTFGSAFKTAGNSPQNIEKGMQNTQEHRHSSVERPSPVIVTLTDDDDDDKNAALGDCDSWKCDICHKMFNSFETFTAHMGTHFIKGRSETSVNDATNEKQIMTPDALVTLDASKDDIKESFRSEKKTNVLEQSVCRNLPTSATSDNESEVAGEADCSDIDSDYKAESDETDGVPDEVPPIKEEISECFTCTECKKQFSHRQALDDHVNSCQSESSSRRQRGEREKDSQPEEPSLTTFQQQTKVLVNIPSATLQPSALLLNPIQMAVASAKVPIKRLHPEKIIEVKCFKCQQMFTSVEEGLKHHEDHFQLKKVSSPAANDGAEGEEAADDVNKVEADEYLCPFCDKPLGVGGAIVEHIKSHWPFKCQRCERRYFRRIKLYLHEKSCTGEKAGCPLCIKPRSPATLPSHILRHIKNICPVCGEACIHISRVKEHLMRHLDINPFSCKLCGGSYRTKQHLGIHFKAVHLKEPYSCNRCNGKFFTKRNLQRHRETCVKTRSSKATKDNKLRFECDSCKKKFREKHNLLCHIQRVCYKSLYREFQCDQCKKWFATEGMLRSHIKQYHTRRLCEICGKSVCHMDIHLETHSASGEKKYKCADCGQAFRRTHHLEAHMRKHTGERPYQCDECESRFKTVGHLINHRETHKPHSERRRVVRRSRPATRVPKN